MDGISTTSCEDVDWWSTSKIRRNQIHGMSCSSHRDKILWEEQFNALQEEQEKKGNLRNLDRAKSSWLTRQRRAFSTGKLNPHWIERLEGLGVCLVLNESKRNKRKITPENQTKWLEKLGKYQEYIAENGHGNVPRRFKANGLGDWVHRQRKSYVEMKESSHPILRERFRALNETNFVWGLK